MVLATIIMLSSVSLTAVALSKEDISATAVKADSIAPTSAESSEIVSISAGAGMSAAVRNDGSLWTWGCKDLTQSGSTWGNHWSVDAQYKGLGLAVAGNVIGSPVMSFSKSTKAVLCSQGKTDTSISPASNTPMVPGVTSVLKDDNSLWVWGGGCYGVLGDGESRSSHAVWTPTKVLDDVLSYDVSGLHFGAVTSDGSLYMWGRNCYGQIGNNSTEDVLTPVKILSGVSSVAVGNNFSAAVMKDGSLWTWGRNNNGQLGDNTTEDSLVPKMIMTSVKKVSLGDSFGAALKTDGSIWTWGNNNAGQLGIGTLGSNKSSPTKVIDLEDDTIIDIDAGSDNMAALKSNHVLYMWGGNKNGKLGNGSTSNQPDPIVVMRDVALVSTGESHTLAAKTNGTLWSWGGNSNGQLGNHTTEAKNRPTEITLGELKVDFNVEDAGIKNLSVIWDDNFLHEDATKYNEDFAVDGIILSEATYSRSSVLTQFGFKILSNGLSNDSIDKPGYLIGYKVMYDFDEPQVEVIMAIRGTKSLLSVDALTDIKSVNDGFDGPTNYCYERLKEARATIAKELGNLGLSNSKKNTKYYIAGHSLGGACAGKLALKMSNDGVAYSSNLYVYTYAAPNYTNIDKQLDSVDDLPNIFNIVNTEDTVPKTPALMAYYWVIPITLHKAGHTLELSPTTVDDFFTHIYNLYGENPWDTLTPVKAHKTATYLALVQGYNERVHSIVSKNILYRFLSVHCPVDVEVYNNNNELCAFTKGDTVFYPIVSPVRILLVEDEKYIELPDDSYRVKCIGTDSGTMKVKDQIVDSLSGKVEYEKVFDHVTLKEGKMFASNITGDNDTSLTDLKVIDDEGDSIYNVDVNGNETKIAQFELKSETVHITANDQQYDGTEKTAVVTVDGLTEGKDYRVIYENNIEVGTASVIVKGINLYEGRVTETFDIYDNGDLGEDIQWSLSSDGTLTVNGRGSINDFGTDNENTAPWKKHAAGITKLVLGEGIETIGNNAFSDITELTEAHIPSTVTAISESAFLGSENVVIYGSSDSYAVAYAKEQGLSYVCTDIPVFILGDTDGDNKVTITDATMIQKYLAEYDVSETFIFEAANTDGDGRITISDATVIQRYLAEIDVPEGIGKVIV